MPETKEELPSETAAESPSTSVETVAPAKRRFNLKRLVPVFVLLLAGVILFGVAGGWTNWVGAALPKKPITPFSELTSLL